jgi:hypothetical protein
VIGVELFKDPVEWNLIKLLLKIMIGIPGNLLIPLSSTLTRDMKLVDCDMELYF